MVSGVSLDSRGRHDCYEGMTIYQAQVTPSGILMDLRLVCGGTSQQEAAEVCRRRRRPHGAMISGKLNHAAASNRLPGSVLASANAGSPGPSAANASKRPASSKRES